MQKGHSVAVKPAYQVIKLKIKTQTAKFVLRMEEMIFFQEYKSFAIILFTSILCAESGKNS